MKMALTCTGLVLLLSAGLLFACGNDSIPYDERQMRYLVQPVPTPTRTPTPTPLALSQMAADEYEFSQVSSGYAHTCGILTNGEVRCWGSNRIPFGHYVGQSVAPPIVFLHISAGYAHTCGVRWNGTVKCWGSDADAYGRIFGQSSPPGGRFTQVSSGEIHTCGVRRDGSVECWGSNVDEDLNYTGQSNPPEGKFASVSAGRYHTCGLGADGEIECWGSFRRKNNQTPMTIPSGAFVSVSSGSDHACGLRPDGTAECFGYGENGQTRPPHERFTAIASAGDYSCGMSSDGTVQCWGDVGALPKGKFANLGTGYQPACGIKADGGVSCWGSDQHGRATPPIPGSIAISVGGHNLTGEHACEIRESGALECWGEYYGSSPGYQAPDGEFISVDVQPSYACGVRSNGDLVCWGWNYDPGGTVIGPDYVMVSAGEEAYCGVRKDGTLNCQTPYGGGSPGHPRVDIEEVTPSEAGFASVSVGIRHACALRVSGEVVCFGDDYVYSEHCAERAPGQPQCDFKKQGERYGATMSPEGPFIAVSAGSRHTCGLRPEGFAECWGDNIFGQSTPEPPQGEFIDIAAGFAHTCGIFTSGEVRCWGTGDTGNDTIAANLEVRPDGTTVELPADSIEGYDGFLPYAPSDLPFVSIDAGPGYTCGVRIDRTIRCWGSIAR